MLGRTIVMEAYGPVICTVARNEIREAISVMEAGLDYTRECLSTHESTLGRTITKNKLWAEHMEADIVRMEKMLELWKNFKA